MHAHSTVVFAFYTASNKTKHNFLCRNKQPLFERGKARRGDQIERSYNCNTVRNHAQLMLLARLLKKPSEMLDLFLCLFECCRRSTCFRWLCLYICVTSHVYISSRHCWLHFLSIFRLQQGMNLWRFFYSFSFLLKAMVFRAHKPLL